MESVNQSKVFDPWLFLLTVVRDALYGGFEELSWAMILLALLSGSNGHLINKIKTVT